MLHFGRIKTRSLSSLCFFVSFVVCLCVAGCAGAAKHAAWSTATGGEQHERLMWEAIQKKDWTEVEHHLSPTFVGVNARGEMLDRAGWIAYWKNAAPRDLSLGEENVQPEGPDMKVTYIIHLPGAGNRSTDEGFRVISIWQELKARWLLTATSITPVQGQ